MKLQHIIALGAATLFATVACDRKPSLKDDKAKVSYAIGQNIAKNIKAQNIELDPAVVGYAVKSGLKGDKPELSEEEQQKAIQNLQQAAQAKAMEDAQKNKGASEQFLAQNKSKPNVKTTASVFNMKSSKRAKAKNLVSKTKSQFTTRAL